MISLDIVIDVSCEGVLEVMLRKHLVKLASLVPEMILRLIHSVLALSSNGHP